MSVWGFYLEAPARSVLHGVTEEGVPASAIAEVIGRQLD